jgi:asparagine synthase (glutamine-hydrolysing)
VFALFLGPYSSNLDCSWRWAAKSLPLTTGESGSWEALQVVTYGHCDWPRRVYSSLWSVGDLTFILDGRLTHLEGLKAALGIPVYADATPEVLVAQSYRRWGRDCIQHFYGACSLCVWDSTDQSFWVAVGSSFSGAQPIYWATTSEGLVVSSVLPLVKAAPGVNNTLNFAALAMLLASWPPCGSTAYEHIQMLQPGHQLTWRIGGGVDISRWWRPSQQVLAFTSSESHAEEVAGYFECAVAEALTSSGPMGAQVSGGLDSTLSASFAASKLLDEGRTLYAWTQRAIPGINAEISSRVDADEWPVANLVAQRYGNVVHKPVYAGYRCLLDTFERQHRLLETPVRNSVNHQWIGDIFEQASSLGCEAVFTGYIGNMTVSYSPNRQQATLSALRHAQFAGAYRQIRSAGWKEPYKLLRFLAKGGIVGKTQSIRDEFTGLDSRLGLVYRGDLRELLRRGLAELPSAEEDLRLYLITLNSAFVADSRYLAGIDALDPTADRRVVEAMLELPSAAYFHNNFGRAQARLIGKGVVPDPIRWRTRRGVQAAEQAGYFRLFEQRYRAAWELVSGSGLTDLLGRSELQAMAEIVLQGRGTLFQASVFFSVLDVGLFVHRSGQSWPSRLAL